MDHDDKQDSKESDDTSNDITDDDSHSTDQKPERPEGKCHETTDEVAALDDATSSKPSLNKTEKITLAALGVLLIGLLAWGCIWLLGQEKMADREMNVELPVKGKHATISDLSITWITPPKEIGMNPDAVIVPSATITLDAEAGGKGTLRLYFQNAAGEIVGDSMTLAIQNGKFPNGSDALNIIATDGFHTEGEFYAYLEDNADPWKLVILEARVGSSSGSDFNELVNTPLGGKRR